VTLLGFCLADIDNGMCLLLPGTTVCTRGDQQQYLEVPPACSLALPYDDDKDTRTHELRLPKDSVVNCGDCCSNQRECHSESYLSLSSLSFPHYIVKHTTEFI
jgi:hypothetical protein